MKIAIVVGSLVLFIALVIVFSWRGDRFDGVEPMCDAGGRDARFEVSEGQAIALVAGDRKIDCDLVSTEPHEAGTASTWSVHIETEEGCSFGGKVHATTGAVSERFSDCD